jgi:PadR family transcriptional regulator PadR
MGEKRQPRLSLQALRVLALLAERPQQGLAGAEIRRSTGIASGTLYPILARLEAAGWLQSRWEQVDPSEVGRPRRRFYSLTAVGAREVARTFQEQLAFRPGRLAWA